MRIAGIVVTGLLCACASWAQAAEFVDDFDREEMQLDASGRKGWAFMTGDGQAVIDFTQGAGVGVIEVDARQDQRNIWWAIIRRSVSASIDGNVLHVPGKELRVEARIRSSHAPRRVNLHFNHSRTTDFHSHLMEFDIANAGEWHVISMTTQEFDAIFRSDLRLQRGGVGIFLCIGTIVCEESGRHAVSLHILRNEDGEGMPTKQPIVKV